MYGCIDGFSRCILWFKVVCLNNLFEILGQYYIEIVVELGGVLVEFVIDLGIENGLIVFMQCYFRENNDVYRYVFFLRN